MPVQQSVYALRSKERATPYSKDAKSARADSPSKSPTQAHYKPPVSPTKVATQAGLPVYPAEHKKLLQQIKLDAAYQPLRPTVHPQDSQVALNKDQINIEVARHGQQISTKVLRHRAGGATSPSKTSPSKAPTHSPTRSSGAASPTKIPVANASATTKVNKPTSPSKHSVAGGSATSAVAQDLHKLQHDIKTGAHAVVNTVNQVSNPLGSTASKKSSGQSK